MEEKRLCYVDFIKGIGIVLVVLGHSEVPENIKICIYMFHMPLFFMLSGYLSPYSVNIDFISITKKYAKRLLYPYFVIGIMYMVFGIITKCLAHVPITSFKILKQAIALLYGNYIWENNYDYIGTLWFLVALFSTEELFFLAKRWSKNNKKIFAQIIVGMITVGVSYPLFLAWINDQKNHCYFGGGRLPFGLDVALTAIHFFALGVWARKYVNRCSFITAMLLITIGVAVGMLNTLTSGARVDMLCLQYGNVLLFMLSASCISIGLLYIGKAIYLHGYSNKLIEDIGSNSMLIMAFHLKIMPYINKLLYSLGFISSYFKGWICAAITVIITWVLSKVIKKILPIILDYNVFYSLIVDRKENR